MTPKERAAMQQALEALENGSWDYSPEQDEHEQCDKAITALREALAKQAEQEPVGYFAYDEEHDIWEELTGPNAPGATPLYAAPVRTKDLTDDEIREIEMSVEPFAIDLARAVIAADRSKNGIV